MDMTHNYFNLKSEFFHLRIASVEGFLVLKKWKHPVLHKGKKTKRIYSSSFLVFFFLNPVTHQVL